jgi:hypothetical protein
MDVNDRFIRLEDALIDLATVMTEGHISRFGSHMTLDVRYAGERFQAFHSAILIEREF